MLFRSRVRFGDIVEEIFSKKTKQESIDLIKQHTNLWTQMSAGSQGFSGKKTVNASTNFNKLFSFD